MMDLAMIFAGRALVRASQRPAHKEDQAGSGQGGDKETRHPHRLTQRRRVSWRSAP